MFSLCSKSQGHQRRHRVGGGGGVIDLKGASRGGSRGAFPIANEGCSYQIRLTMQNPPEPFPRFHLPPGAALMPENVAFVLSS